MIVEDERTLAEHLRSLLEGLGWMCSVYHDGLLADAAQAESDFDLVLLDLQIPSLPGTELCRRIRARDPHIPIIVLTAFSDLDTKLLTFEYGADDFISKPFHGKELLAKVNVFLKRSQRAPDSPETIVVANLVIDLVRKTVFRNNIRITLSPKEFALLVLLASKQGKVVSKIDIARTVWNVNFDTGTNTIEVYISMLRNKIDKPFATKLLHTRPGFGYTLSEDAE